MEQISCREEAGHRESDPNTLNGHWWKEDADEEHH